MISRMKEGWLAVSWARRRVRGLGGDSGTELGLFEINRLELDGIGDGDELST